MNFIPFQLFVIFSPVQTPEGQPKAIAPVLDTVADGMEPEIGNLRPALQHLEEIHAPRGDHPAQGLGAIPTFFIAPPGQGLPAPHDGGDEPDRNPASRNLLFFPLKSY